MTTKQEAKLAFILQFVEEYSAEHGREACVKAAGELLRLAKRRQSLGVQQCNGPQGIERIPYPRAGVLIEEWQESIEKRVTRVVARIAAVCAPFKLPVESHGDPRGCVVCVRFPSGARNGWGDGWGVPT